MLDELAGLCVPVTFDYRWRPQARDPDDDLVLETAINGAADVIASFNVADMHAASLAGVLGIAVVSGAHDTRALREAGAASVIPSLAALPATIERLLD